MMPAPSPSPQESSEGKSKKRLWGAKTRWLVSVAGMSALLRFRFPAYWLLWLVDAAERNAPLWKKDCERWMRRVPAAMNVLLRRWMLPQLSMDWIAPEKRVRLRKLFLLATTSLCTVCGAAACTYLQELWVTLPIVNAESLRPIQSIRLLDRDGREFYRIYGDEDRVTVQSDDIPQHLKNALIAIEDERFYSRGCIDVRALLRAFFANVSAYKSQGASTITQQLVRNAYLSPEKKISRKVQEILLACRLEHDLTRDEILTLYLNRIPFGHSIYGVRQAAMAYFGVEPKDLTLAQSAILAALPQRPSYYSPYNQHKTTVASRDVLRELRKGTMTVDKIPEDDLSIGLIARTVRAASGTILLPGRSTFVLQNMLRLGFISEKDFKQALAQTQTVAFRPRGQDKLEAAHFALLMRNTVQNLIDEKGEDGNWQKAGLSVVTTLDSRLQGIAEDTIADLFPAIAKKNHAENIALVALNRRTREVLAYVGSSDYFDETTSGKIDMVQVPRQPGSSFKPLVYAAAFLKGYTPSTIIWDSPLHIGTVTPKNYDGTFKGPLPIRIALAWSRNIPAIRAFLFAGGEDAVLSVASAAGITTPEERRQTKIEQGVDFTYGWPLALGSAEVPLWEMVQAYATLSQSGSFLPIKTIRQINDAEGAQIFATPPTKPKQSIPASVAGDITNILSDEQNRPAGYWRKQLTIPNIVTGVKTGTSNVCFLRLENGTCKKFGVNNTWTIGFAKDLVVGVWVGNADNSSLAPKADGLTAAAPIWKEFLLRAMQIDTKKAPAKTGA